MCMTPPRLTWIALCLAGCLLAACDGGDKPASMPASTVGATAAAVTPLSEADVRRITREEIERALAAQTVDASGACDIATAAARAMPSVVQVEVRRAGTAVVVSSATGFAALAGGIVVTAAHVINEPRANMPNAALDVTLITVDGRRLDARILRVDATRDLAVLRADDRRLPPVRWADSAAVALGEPVRIIGFPIGRKGVTVTGGVLANRVADPDRQRDELFTDANADPGNSGGPLLTSCGDALGVVVERRAIDRSFTTVTVDAATALPFVLAAAGSDAMTPIPGPTTAASP
jgi:S1-C subfamily serine protease